MSENNKIYANFNSKEKFTSHYLDEHPDDVKKANSSKAMFRQTYMNDEAILQKKEKNSNKGIFLLGSAFLTVCVVSLSQQIKQNDKHFESFVTNNMYNAEVIDNFQKDVENASIIYTYTDDFNSNVKNYTRYLNNENVNPSKALRILAMFEHENKNNKNNVKEAFTDISKLNKDDYVNYSFLKILDKTEAFKPSFYKDNKGIAILYGWNISRNSPEFNKNVIDKLNLSENDAQAIMRWSNVNVTEVPVDLESIHIDRKSAANAVNYMYEFYYNEFKEVMLTKYEQRLKQKAKRDKTITDDTIFVAKKLISQNFDLRFSNDEKALFAHMAYKLGKNNLMNYNNFYSKINTIIKQDNFTKPAFQELAQEVNYQFRDGNRLVKDHKTEQVHREYLAKRF